MGRGNSAIGWVGGHAIIVPTRDNGNHTRSATCFYSTAIREWGPNPGNWVSDALECKEGLQRSKGLGFSDLGSLVEGSWNKDPAFSRDMEGELRLYWLSPKPKALSPPNAKAEAGNPKLQTINPKP